MLELVKRMWAQHAILMGILGVGLFVRLIFLFQIGGTGFKIIDERDYYHLGSSLLSGLGFAWGPDRPTSMRAPLYPGFLAVIWAIVGERSLLAIRLFQVVISLANVVLLYHVGQRLFSKKVGLIAAAIFCFYPSFIAFNFLLLTEVLFTFLLTLFVFGYVVLVQTNKGKVALGLGIVLGLAALTRSILWPFPLVLCPLMFFTLSGEKSTRLKLAGLLFLGYVIVITPWAVRNTNLQGVLTIVNSAGGMTLMMGNYENTPDNRPWDPSTMRGEKSIFANLKKQHPESSEWTVGQKEQWAKKQALAYMVEHPVVTFKRTIKKFGSFWGLERTILAGFNVGYYHPPRWFVLMCTILIPLGFALVMIFGCLGLFLAVPEDRRVHWLLILLFLFVSGLHSVVFGHSRYHLPLMPLVGLYAAAAISCRSWNQLRFGMARAVGPVMACGLLVFAWGREILVVEADRIRVFVHSLFG